MEDYIAKFDIQVAQTLLTKIQGRDELGWKVVMKDNVVSPLALDLLSKLVVIDHTERISAEEALRHPYFNECEDDVPPPCLKTE